MLTFGSVCSGIEAASVAWEGFGWRAAWLAEVDKAASEVLAHRFPGVPNHGDMTLLAGMIRRREIPAPDLLVGGTPCQSFSLAGLRRGLADGRGQLTLAFVDLANAIDEVRIADCLPPCIIVWENVPGVLSSKDNAFGCFLAGLAGEPEAIEPGPRPERGRSTAHWAWEKAAGEHRPKWTVAGAVAGPERSIAWVIRDAQYFGLAQRRRRVFVVAGAGAGFDPAAILLEFDGVRRDSAPSRSAWKDVAGPLDARVGGGGFPGTDGACANHIVAHGAGDRGSSGLIFAKEVCPTLRAGGNQTGGDRPPGTDVDTADSLMVYAPVPPCWDGRDVSQTLDAVLHKGQTMPEKNRFPAVLQPISYRLHAMNSTAMSGEGEAEAAFRSDSARCLDTTGGFTAYQGGEIVLQPIPFDTTQITSPGNYSSPAAGDPCHPLAAGAHPPAIAFTVKDFGQDVAVETAPTLHSMNAAPGRPNGGGQVGVAYSIARDALDRSGEASDGSAANRSGLGIDVDGAATLKSKGPGAVVSDAVCVTGSVTHTLKAEGFDASEDGTGRGQPIVNSPYTMAVRRLMPVECERLQGFPDDWTLVPTGARRKPAADGPRYKQLGNSMAVNVMRWIGGRIDSWVRAHPSAVGHNSFDIEELLG